MVYLDNQFKKIIHSFKNFENFYKKLRSFESRKKYDDLRIYNLRIYKWKVSLCIMWSVNFNNILFLVD